MKYQIKVSVLTPIYNHSVEFVRECLDSLHSQTMRDIEFILIDNGATRESQELIEEFIAKDSRFRCLHLVENVGYGRAMNYGLREARGEYVGFLESDDIALPTMFERLYDVITKHRCDIVKCDWLSYWGKDSDKNAPHHNFKKEFCNKVFEPSYFPRFFLADPAIWTGLYRVEFIRENKLFFIESPTARYQDTSFNFKVLATVKRMYCIDEVLVQYRRNTPNSSVKDRSAVFALVEEYDEIEAFLEARNELRKRLIYVKNYNKARSYRWNHCRSLDHDKKKFFELFQRDFLAAVRDNELDRSFFTDEEAEWLSRVVGVRFFFFHNSNLNISFSFDNNYFYQAMVAIASLLDQARSSMAYNFYLIIASGIPKARQDELKEFILSKSPDSRVVYCFQSDILKNGYEVRGITRSAYYRLMLHRILPDIDSVVYSDVDVLFRTSLEELKRIPIENYAIAAVKDMMNNLRENWNGLSSKFSYWEPLLSGMYREYCNSGFLYLNLKKIRSLNWDQLVIKYASEKLYFQDQDILNILFVNRKELIYHLHPRYIFMPKHLMWGNYARALKEGLMSRREFLSTKYNPAIYHYAGPLKPWSHPSEPYNLEWCRYVYANSYLQDKFSNLKSHHRLFGLIETREMGSTRMDLFLNFPYFEKRIIQNCTEYKLLRCLRKTVKSEYTCFSFFEIPILEKRTQSELEKINFGGITLYSKYQRNNYKKRKTLLGLYKIINSGETKNYYILGLRIARSTHRKKL